MANGYVINLARNSRCAGTGGHFGRLLQGCLVGRKSVVWEYNMFYGGAYGSSVCMQWCPNGELRKR